MAYMEATYVSWKGNEVKVFDDNHNQLSNFFIIGAPDETIVTAVVQGPNQIVITTDRATYLYTSTDKRYFNYKSKSFR